MLHGILTRVHVIISRRTNNNKTRGAPLRPGRRQAYRWVHSVMDELGTEIACIRLGNCHVIAVRSPEMAREFLKKHDAVFASRPVTVATRILSHGFITTGMVPWGDQWKKMRKVLVSNVFTHSNMRWLLHKRNQEADNLVRFIHNQCSNGLKGGVVNVRTAPHHYSASIIRRMVLNKRYFGEGRGDGGPDFEDLEHFEAVGTMVRYVYAFSVSDYLPWLEWLDLDGHRKKVCDAMRVIKKYQDPIVNDRIRQWRDGIKTEPEDLLDVFISLKDSDAKSVLSDEEIRAQITELFLAGIDNSYNTAEWTLSEMLNQPEMMEKAVEELDRVVAKDRLLQESDIPNLPYLTACAREALRLHPVEPFNLPHTSTTDCTVSGYFVPKGSSVLISRLGLGRNPKVWDEPLQFDPGRHLADSGSRRVDLAEDELRFVTFSVGRRGCTSIGVGSNMIMMLLGRLLQGFSWEIPDGSDKIDLTEAVTLFKAEPLVALAKPRLNASVYLSVLESM